MSSECLNNLWELIKDVPHLKKEEHSGLEEVAFSLPIEEFSYRNWQKHKEVLEKIDSYICNANKAVTLLENKNVRCHHLSCAGENNALCIHYLDKGRVIALTIPGVTYS